VTYTVHNSSNFNTVQGTRLKPRRSTVHTFPQLELAILKTHISYTRDDQNHKTTYNIAEQNNLPTNGLSSKTGFTYRTSDSSQKFIRNTLSKFGMFFIE